ncbi:hypothetical protein [Paraburkholderia atlantica]|uniref:hypothetical protein n=1 Tax=Paraburkholderia atlantica TaxID=2654982 RepID=UPI0016189F20|nr:hypothetical protein [Paraburkholderia atlantica]MBB5414068.1 DNA-directed RNA polymerase subunit RPC12/RpoP [Paraburkholderia atlantica]
MGAKHRGLLKRRTCKDCGAEHFITGGGSYFLCDECRIKAPIASAWGGAGGAHACNMVRRATQEGSLPAPSALKCSDCGCQASVYDHRDYNKPLDVDAVCQSCNLKRGPAIPRKGFFAHMFATGHAHYRTRHRMTALFKAMNLEADLSGLPSRLTIEHWLPFKAQLLEWESQR